MGLVKIHEGLVANVRAFVATVEAVMMAAVAVDAFNTRVLSVWNCANIPVMEETTIVPALRAFVDPVNPDPEPEPIPATVDISCDVEIYPSDPNPSIVEVMFPGVTAPNTTPVMVLTFNVRVLIDLVMICWVDT